MGWPSCFRGIPNYKCYLVYNACAHILLADDKAASIVFQRHSYDLVQAFGGLADELATQFLSAGFISRNQWEKVQLPNKTTTEKGNLLLAAILPSFDVPGCDRMLRKLCRIMSKHKQTHKLSQKITTKYGKSSWWWQLGQYLWHGMKV